MAKTRERKEERISKLTEDFSDVGSVVFTDYTGINVELMTELRREMRENQVVFTIVKNTLLNRIFADIGIDSKEDVYSLMEGPTAIAYGSDEVTPVKIISKFSKANKGLLKIKGGFVAGESFNVEKMTKLANIPGREVLMAKLLGSMQSPLQGFVSVSGGIIRKFLYALNAVKESEE